MGTGGGCEGAKGENRRMAARQSEDGHVRDPPRQGKVAEGWRGAGRGLRRECVRRAFVQVPRRAAQQPHRDNLRRAAERRRNGQSAHPDGRTDQAPRKGRTGRARHRLPARRVHLPRTADASANDDNERRSESRTFPSSIHLARLSLCGDSRSEAPAWETRCSSCRPFDGVNLLCPARGEGLQGRQY